MGDNLSKIIQSKYLYEEFDKEWIDRNVNAISHENINIYFYSHDHEEGVKLDQTEKWYKTPFSKEKFSDSLINKIKGANTDGMHLPSKNPFFPDNLDIFPKNAEESKEVAQIFKDEHSVVYYQKDDKFETPKL